MSKELIKRAFDTTNGWIYDTSSYAKAVAPAMYEQMVSDYQTKELVLAPLGRQIDFTRPGSTWTVTVDVAPGAGAVVAETDAVTYTAISNRQVTFTPIMYAVAYQASVTEMEDGFLNFMENASKKIGYGLSQSKDALCTSRLYAGATHEVFAGGVSVATDINSTDLFGRELILEASNKVRGAYYKPANLIIAPTQEANLLNESSIYKANEFGTRVAIVNGLVGNLYGVNIYVSDSVTATSNRLRAILLGRSGSGEAAFGIAIARRPTIKMDEDIDYDQIKVVGRERYDVQVIHPGAVCVIHSYDAFK